MAKIKIKVIKVKQPIGTFYVSTIAANVLVNMATSDLRRMSDSNDHYLGIQRPLNNLRIKQIKEYISTFDASFPNSIIVDVKSDYIHFESDDTLVIDNTPDTFIIIDGQHRLAGFRDNSVDNFDLIITIFIDLEKEQQANLFKIINSEHRKVSPSLSTDLEEYGTLRTPRKVAHILAKIFNSDKNSPWYKKIKMLGYSDDLSSYGIISQSTFVRPIIDLIYNDNDYNQIREELNFKSNNDLDLLFEVDRYKKDKYPLWNFYATDNEKALYKVLLNYFGAVEKTFPKQWGNKDYILTKSVGYYAIMNLFRDLSVIGINEGNLSLNFFGYHLQPLSLMSENLTSQNYGSSGESAVTALYTDLSAGLK
jgi:DGQHR domain-containing protein